MSAPRSLRRLQLFEDALERLREALAVPASAPLAIDGTIQRFEFTFELAWKAFQAHLQEQGVVATTPRAAIKEAFAAGWIGDEAGWLDMLSARNQTSHIYNEQMARAIYDRIRADFGALAAALPALKCLRSG